MLLLNGAVGLAMFGLWVFCLIDVITTDESLCRNLRKAWWILIVLFLFDVGALLWLVAGRPWSSGRTSNLSYRGNTGFPEYERPGRSAAPTPEDDEEFLRRCRERAEEQRRRYQQQQQQQPPEPDLD